MKITVSVSNRAAQALRDAPATMERHIDPKLSRGAEEVAREAKRLAPKLYSTLASSIRAERVGQMNYRVSTGMNYARAAEEGTGPAAGKARYYPNPESLMQFLMMTPSWRGRIARVGIANSGGWATSFNAKGTWAKLGSKRRGTQELELWLRSRAMAWAIYMKGTKAQPYMKPAAEAKTSRLIELVRQGVVGGLREVRG